MSHKCQGLRSLFGKAIKESCVVGKEGETLLLVRLQIPLRMRGGEELPDVVLIISFKAICLGYTTISAIMMQSWNKHMTFVCIPNNYNILCIILLGRISWSRECATFSCGQFYNICICRGIGSIHWQAEGDRYFSTNL